MLLQAYSGEISSEYYKMTLKQLIKLIREYIANLNELKQFADEKELIDESFQIKEEIEQITEEMLDIPQSKEDAINYIEQVKYIDSFLYCKLPDGTCLERDLCCVRSEVCFTKPNGVVCSKGAYPSRLVRIESNKPAMLVTRKKKSVGILDFSSFIYNWTYFVLFCIYFFR